jgi:tRNA modification GTPase
LLGVLARIEASIDFPEDVGELDTSLCRDELNRAASEIRTLLVTADQGMLYREGALVVLAGRTNAGKSSLMNALLRVSRAIVTPIPGTTRDVIEETLNVGGIPVRLADTAGIRETEDIVEQLGVERSRRSVAEAALVVLVVDGSRPVTAEDDALLDSLSGRRFLIVENKADIATESLPRLPGAVAVSALTGAGLDDLEAAIARHLLGSDQPLDTMGQQAVITHARHKNALVLAGERLVHADDTLAASMPPDFLAIDVRGAISALEEITGVSTPDDIINEIFSRFCIGK